MRSQRLPKASKRRSLRVPEREHAQQQQPGFRGLRVPEPGEAEAGHRRQLPGEEGERAGREPGEPLEGEAHRLHDREQQPHRLQGEELVAAAACDVAPAQPLQHPPAEQCGDGGPDEQECPEGLRAVEAERAADADRQAHRRLALPRQPDRRLCADYRDQHEGEHQRSYRTDAPVQEGEQQHGRRQVGAGPETREIERRKLRVARQRHAARASMSRT